MRLSALLVLAAGSTSLFAICNPAAAAAAQVAVQGPPNETLEEGVERMKHPLNLAPERMTVHVPQQRGVNFMGIPIKLGLYVGNSSAVNACIGSILSSWSNVSCPSGVASQVAQSESEQTRPEAQQLASDSSQQDSNQQQPLSQEELEERNKRPSFLAPERMVVDAPSHAIPVAVPYQIVVTMAPGKLVGPITVTQREPSGSPVPAENSPFKIVAVQGNQRTIQVVPGQVGKITLEISALYDDNAVVVQFVKINVIPTAKGLKSVSLGLGPVFPLVLEEPKAAPNEWTPHAQSIALQPQLNYKSLPYSIHVTDISALPVTIEQPEDDPVIRIENKNGYGVIYPIRPGTATVTCDIGGIKDSVEVTVFATEQDVKPLTAPRLRKPPGTR